VKRLGILLSGRGSNFRAIHQAILSGQLSAEIACVLSNVPSAAGLAYAREQRLPAFALESRGVPRSEFDAQLAAILTREKVDLVCLAGYMRILTPEFVSYFPDRILNIHPSLLPAFPGLHAQRQALAYGVKISGCTVHYVDAGVDTGRILLQTAVPVLDDDTEESLSDRILEQEHKLYPVAIAEALRRLG
jgi:phosphoribosylglycinamide formyltransferase-1